jgi:hypothetical protein
MSGHEEHVFSASQLDSFNTCRRRYYWSYIRSIEPRARNWHLIGGTMVHAVLEALYKTKFDVKEAIKASIKFAKEVTGQGFMSVEDEFERDRFLAMCEGLARAYLKQYPNENKRHVLEVEAAFDNVRVGGYMFKGILDLIVSEAQGKVTIVDHKSASRVTPAILSVLPLRYQSLVYTDVATTVAGRDVVNMEYNFFVKPGLYQGKKETCGEFFKRLTAAIAADSAKYFYRETVRMGPERKKMLLSNVSEVCADITKLREPGTPMAKWYRCPPSCSMYGKACEFLPLCLDGKKDSVMALYKDKAPEDEKGAE